MADSTNDTLRQQFEQIRDERGLHANTATRIGNAFLALLSYVGSLNLPYLRKDIDDTAEGVITFAQGFISEVLSYFKNGAQFGEFISGMIAGTGGQIDGKGNAEFQSLKVRGSMQVLELIINRLLAMEGDYIFTESDTIDSVEDIGNGVYRLYLRAKWDGYYTAQVENNVIKGIINNLDKGSGTSYTSWMRVNAVNTENNYIDVVLYADDETPDGKNYLPVEAMNIARWGNQSDTDRQSCFYISSSEGRFAKLRDVTKPIIDKTNYGTILGDMPDFVKDLKSPSGNNIVVYDNRDYLYAMGIVVQDLIEIDYQGKPICKYVDRGQWVSGGLYYCQEKNPETGVYEISDVWHYGCKWRCAKNLTTSEPVFNNTDWAMIEGDPIFYVDFVEQEQLYDFDNFSAALTIAAILYNQDVTSYLADSDVVWTRYTTDLEGIQRTDSDEAWNLKRGGAGKSIILTRSDLSIETFVPPTIKFTATVTLKTEDGEEVATDSVSMSIG